MERSRDIRSADRGYPGVGGHLRRRGGSQADEEQSRGEERSLHGASVLQDGSYRFNSPGKAARETGRERAGKVSACG